MTAAQGHYFAVADSAKSNRPDPWAVRAEIGSTTPKEREEQHSAATPALLREFAAALDLDRGHDKSMTTRVMRTAADDLERCEGRLRRQVEFHRQYRERAIAAEQALGLYGKAEHV